MDLGALLGPWRPSTPAPSWLGLLTCHLRQWRVCLPTAGFLHTEPTTVPVRTIQSQPHSHPRMMMILTLPQHTAPPPVCVCGNQQHPDTAATHPPRCKWRAVLSHRCRRFEPSARRPAKCVRRSARAHPPNPT